MVRGEVLSVRLRLWLLAAALSLSIAATGQQPGDSATDGEAEQVPVADHIDLKDVVREIDSPAATPEPEPAAVYEAEVEETVAAEDASAPADPDAAGPSVAGRNSSDEAHSAGDDTMADRGDPERLTIESGPTDATDRAGGEDSPDVSLEPVPIPSVAESGEPADAAAQPEAAGEAVEEVPDAARILLGVKVPPATATRLNWVPVESFGDLTVNTPVLVVNGATAGQTLCLTAAVHGDELNGIEMIRRVVYELDPKKLTGTVIGVPIVNMTAFRRASRYLPDRRDLNRHFPGNPTGSGAARMAHSFFSEVVDHCDALVDLHTGSFHRSNLPQLRADLSDPAVRELSRSFGSITVLNSRGQEGSLRAAAVRAGIPAVTLEAGEPMRLQTDVVAEGTRAIEALMHKMGMYSRLALLANPTPAYYKSYWVRADQSGFLFSNVTLGKLVREGEVLGRVTDPITNKHTEIVSPYRGRVLGMAVDQMVLPGFAAYHIGIQTPESGVDDRMPALEDELYHDDDVDADPDLLSEDGEILDAEEE